MRRLIILAAIAAAGLIGVAFYFALRDAKRRAASIDCTGSMSSIHLAAIAWARDHGGQFPPDFASMSNELFTPKVLICQGDSTREWASDWSGFSSANSSYEMTGPGIRLEETNNVFFICRIHGHRSFADGRLAKGDCNR